VPKPPRAGDLVALERDACIEHLEQAPYVRIGFVVDGEPMVLPVNHLLHDGAIYFRTAPGSKLGSAAAGNNVVIEADEGDEQRRIGWSVVAKGRASIVLDEAEIEALLAQPFEPWALPDNRSFWIRVDVQDLEGRRIIRPE
jgi:uncharacterized protein